MALSSTGTREGKGTSLSTVYRCFLKQKKKKKTFTIFDNITCIVHIPDACYFGGSITSNVTNDIVNSIQVILFGEIRSNAL